jgi:ADP-ribose pyrophosphatase YjhB (NUDIX family)
MKKDEATRAAALPYRREDDRTVFCLVTTKQDEPERWTFPKGRLDPKHDESLADTARREAREEAGVKGRLDGKRLTSYRYPRRSGDAVVVAAFLLEARRWGLVQDRDDRTRSVGWFDAEEAQQRLAQNREAEYVHEAVRVLREAVAATGEDA